jgi:hypothetical protein
MSTYTHIMHRYLHTYIDQQLQANKRVQGVHTRMQAPCSSSLLRMGRRSQILVVRGMHIYKNYDQSELQVRVIGLT